MKSMKPKHWLRHLQQPVAFRHKSLILGVIMMFYFRASLCLLQGLTRNSDKHLFHYFSCAVTQKFSNLVVHPSFGYMLLWQAGHYSLSGSLRTVFALPPISFSLVLFKNHSHDPLVCILVLQHRTSIYTSHSPERTHGACETWGDGNLRSSVLTDWLGVVFWWKHYVLNEGEETDYNLFT